MKTSCKRLLLCLIFIPLCLVAIAQNLTGKVIRIADGDTLTLLDSDNNQTRIRLHGIDCPERTQPYYRVATRFLSDMVFGKIVTVEILDVDRYGRTIGKIWLDNVDVNLLLLENGLAWHYKYFDKSEEYANAEANARKQKLNIWSMSNPVAPWDFRRRQ